MVTFFKISQIFQKTVASQCTVGDTVIFTGPPKTEQKLWPGHCVQESWGSNFHKDLIVSLISFYHLNYRPGQPNWEGTMYKFQDFSATQILHHIKIVHLETPKTAIWTS